MQYQVADLLPHLPQAQYSGQSNVVISGLAYDSRQVKSDDAFVCWHGEQFDGHDYAADAVRRGAALLIAERPIQIDCPQIVVPNSRRAMGTLAAIMFAHPSRALKLIGITGTNGKTTTSYFIKAMLDEANIKTGLIGTIEHIIGEQRHTATHTTPESPEIQRLLAQMVSDECQACVMEVSSHGIDRERLQGCQFSFGIFMNLTQDHLNYHVTFEAYRETKTRLFHELHDTAIVNADDPHASFFISASNAPVLCFGIDAEQAHIRAKHIRVHARGTEFVAITPREQFAVQLSITGRFNVYNALAAIAVGHRMGLHGETIAQALAKTQVPGRVERITSDEPFTVLVDYAHTPDGLANVLRAARELTDNELTVVFGAGGDRDRKKRPMMGEIAGELAHKVIITADNPRSEDVMSICKQIEHGIQTNVPYRIIPQRRTAIRQAVVEADDGDVVLIAGKGHETYQEIQGERKHFDDREEVRHALEERMKRGNNDTS